MVESRSDDWRAPPKERVLKSRKRPQRRRAVARHALTESAPQEQRQQEHDHGPAVDDDSANYRWAIKESHCRSSVLRSVFN